MSDLFELREYRGDKLRLARLVKGSSLDELGNILGVTRQNIHKMEAGQEPKGCQVQLLCKHLGIEKNFLYVARNTPVVEEQCHFRSLRSRTKTLTNTIMARAELLDSLIQEIETFFDLPDFTLPVSASFDHYSMNDIERVAEELRRNWELGTGPISDMTIIIENAGVIISTVDGVDERVDAFSLSRKRPIIIRNNAKSSPCRYRFDLAHELGHLVMHDGIITGCKETEKQANYFASSFLMPRLGFLSAVDSFPIVRGTKSLNWRNLGKLKKYFKVSFKAILYRAKSLGVITEEQMRSGYIYINKKGWAKDELLDDEIPVETPMLLESMTTAIDVTRWQKILVKLGLTNRLLRELLPSISLPQRALSLVT